MKVSWLLVQLRARKPRAQRAGYSGALCGEVKPGWGSTPLLSEKKLLKSHTELPLCVWGCVFVCVCEMQGEGISLPRSVWIAGVQWVHPHCGRKYCSGCARACVCVSGHVNVWVTLGRRTVTQQKKSITHLLNHWLQTHPDMFLCVTCEDLHGKKALCSTLLWR